MTSKRFGGPVTEWEDYLLLFRNVRDETAIGEASVSYLWSQTAGAEHRRAHSGRKDYPAAAQSRRQSVFRNICKR